MPYVAARCPVCGADLQVDYQQEKGYCIHCGNMINFSEAIKNVKTNGPIELPGYESFPTLYNQVKKDLKTGNNQTPEFRQRLIRALELAPDDEYLYELVSSEIWNAKIADGVLLQYEGRAKRMMVPEGISAIGMMAFGRNSQLEEILLPKSLKHIAEGAFIYESLLTISAYNGTYAAKYAMTSPAKLNLRDGKTDREKNIEEMESILRELEKFKQSTFDTIEKKMNKIYSINWVLVFMVLIIPTVFMLGSISYHLLDIRVIAAVFVSLFVVVATPILIIKSGYNEIRCRVAIKKQKSLFTIRSNETLASRGIIDYKYQGDIINRPDADVKEEIKRLQKARDKVLGMNTKDVYKKPYIKYSLLEYFSGKKPLGYNK